MNRIRLRVVATSVGVALCVVLTACTAIPGASTGPSAPGESAKVPAPGETPPADKPTPTPECLVRSAAVNAIEPTTENLALVIPNVLVGTFDGYGKARWNTESGERPTGSEDLGILIVRPVKLTADDALRGDVASAVNTVVLGGEVGCSHETFSSEPTLKEGQTYVLFLQDDPEPSHKGSDTKLIGWAWPLTADGLVETPLEGTLEISSIQSTLDATQLVPR